MNAMLNIQVRVAARQALAQIRAVQAAMAQMRTRTAAATGAQAGFIGGLGNAARNVERFGKNVQWSGRQLEYNFTLPLVIAGGMATKWALENEKAMTRVKKVYGDLGEDTTAELKALERSFVLLSNRFGVHLKEVMDIAAGWAQAGAAGVALAKATKLTLQAMIIGEMEAAEATEKLIAVQSAYRLNTEELAAALATLNVIENQTAITFDGLIEVITRAGGAAQTAGIDLRHLSAMAASLVPRAGSASQAGNALRTMISRLLSPTKAAANLLNEMGLEIDTAAWHSKNGVERMQELATSFDGLTQSQKAVVSSTVASRWQINRFDILMRDLKLSLDEATASQSAYWRALDASKDPQRNAAIMAQELSIALSTNERSFAILTTMIKNYMAEAIMPLLPVMVTILKGVVNLTTAFANLSPEMQQTVGMFLLFIAVIGPIGRYVGSVGILLGMLGHALHFVLTAGMSLASFLLSWPGLIAAVVVAIWFFRDEIYNGLVGAFNALPEGIANALITVLNMIKSFALAVYEWLSYINPFARHSPSLVDNVIRGVRTILDEYSKLNKIGSILRGATQAHADFLRVTGRASGALADQEIAQMRSDIVAVAPGAGPAVDSMVASIARMRVGLSAVNSELQKQAALVHDMRTGIDTAMKPMNDAIFENEMAQKKLRLEMLKMERDGGQSIDDIRKKYAALSGDIEKMTSRREDLRLSGAGSEITGTFDREIDSLMAQRKALEGQGAPLDDLRKKMEELQRAGEILTLERDIQFDPQLRALTEQENKLRDLETAYQDIADAIRDMESALTGFAADAASKLAADESARKAAESARKAAADAKKKTGADSGFVPDAIQRFNEAAGGDFEIPGGTTPPGLGREGGLEEILDFNKQMEAELQAALDAMPSIDIWEGLKNGFFRAWDSIRGAIGEQLGPIWDTIVEWWNGLDISGGKNPFAAVGGWISDLWSDFRAGINEISSWFSEEFSGIINELGNWGPVWDDLKETGSVVWGHLQTAVSNGWQGIYTSVSGWIGAVTALIANELMRWAPLFMAAWEGIKIVAAAGWDLIKAFIENALQFLRGLITTFLAIIRGDWGDAWNGIVTMMGAVWAQIWDILNAAWDVISGIVKRIVEGIVGFFKWLYDTLVGNSIIPDMVDAIIAVFGYLRDMVVAIWDGLWKGVEWIWRNVAQPVWDLIVWTINNVLIPAFEFLAKTIDILWKAISTVIKWAWDNVLKPVWTTLINFIKNPLLITFENFKTGVERIWNTIAATLKGIWENSIRPIWNGIVDFINKTLIPGVQRIADRFGDIWHSIYTTASGAWNGILNIMGSAVNVGIRIINKLIDGINLLNKLPGININISHIGEVSWGKVGGGNGGQGRALAAGTNRIPENPFGSSVGSGFKTNRVRAIVGEGNPLYPEYVIPTDPTYRGRAVGLANMLMKDLGINSFNELHPQYDLGGIIGGAVDLAGDAWDATGGKVVSGIRKGAAMAIFGPVNKAAEALINTIPFKLARDVAHQIRNTMYNWVKGTDDKIPEAPEIPDLGMLTWPFMWHALKRAHPGARLFSAFRPGAITATGNRSYHGKGRAIDVTPSMAIFNWIKSNYPNSREIIYSPAGNAQVRNGRNHYYSGITRKMHWDHVHWAMAQGGIIPSMANGGIVLPRPGGTVVRLGEGGRAEAVQPLPRDFSSGRTMNFYGDLEFPNITDPADAETFIANLEALA